MSMRGEDYPNAFENSVSGEDKKVEGYPQPLDPKISAEELRIRELRIAKITDRSHLKEYLRVQAGRTGSFADDVEKAADVSYSGHDTLGPISAPKLGPKFGDLTIADKKKEMVALFKKYEEVRGKEGWTLFGKSKQGALNASSYARYKFGGATTVESEKWSRLENDAEANRGNAREELEKIKKAFQEESFLGDKTLLALCLENYPNNYPSPGILETNLLRNEVDISMQEPRSHESKSPR